MTREDQRIHNERMTARTGLPHLYWDKAFGTWCVRLAGPLPGRLPPPWVTPQRHVLGRVVNLNADLDALPYLCRRSRRQ